MLEAQGQCEIQGHSQLLRWWCHKTGCARGLGLGTGERRLEIRKLGGVWS